MLQSNLDLIRIRDKRKVTTSVIEWCAAQLFLGGCYPPYLIRFALNSSSMLSVKKLAMELALINLR